MNSSMIYRSGLLATAVLLTGMTLAVAQTATDTTPVQAPQAKEMRVDFRMERGARGGGMMGRILQQADANGDRALTQDEIDTFRAALVANADASGDGNISLDEFETLYLEVTRARMVDAFQALDADGDGVVTQAESDARFGDIVDRMDRNQDGQFDRDDRPSRASRDHDRDGRGHDRDGGRWNERRG